MPFNPLTDYGYDDEPDVDVTDPIARIVAAHAVMRKLETEFRDRQYQLGDMIREAWPEIVGRRGIKQLAALTGRSKSQLYAIFWGYTWVRPGNVIPARVPSKNGPHGGPRGNRGGERHQARLVALAKRIEYAHGEALRADEVWTAAHPSWPTPDPVAGYPTPAPWGPAGPPPGWVNAPRDPDFRPRLPPIPPAATVPVPRTTHVDDLTATSRGLAYPHIATLRRGRATHRVRSHDPALDGAIPVNQREGVYRGVQPTAPNAGWQTTACGRVGLPLPPFPIPPDSPRAKVTCRRCQLLWWHPPGAPEDDVSLGAAANRPHPGLNERRVHTAEIPQTPTTLNAVLNPTDPADPADPTDPTSPPEQTVDDVPNP